MGIFNDIMSKIISSASAAGKDITDKFKRGADSTTEKSTEQKQEQQPVEAVTTKTDTVDVVAILDELAKKNSQKLNWKTSIVDLLKLLGLDSSLDARKKLAAELNYQGDMNDSATMNVWLIKEVMKNIAAKGGNVTDLFK